MANKLANKPTKTEQAEQARQAKRTKRRWRKSRYPHVLDRYLIRGKWVVKFGPRNYKELERIAGIGMTLAEIAAHFGVSPATLWKIRDRDPRINEILRDGKKIAKGNIRKVLNELMYSNEQAVRLKAAALLAKAYIPAEFSDRPVETLPKEEIINMAKEIIRRQELDESEEDIEVEVTPPDPDESVDYADGSS